MKDKSRMYKFKISINDGFCEYCYPILLPETTSILDIYRKICDAFGVRSQEEDSICVIGKDDDFQQRIHVR